MDQEIEVLPSSSFQPQPHPMTVVRRPITGSASYGAGGRMLPSQRGAGAPPSILRVERQLPLSFQRTNQHYDGSSRQTVGSTNGKVVLLPRVNINSSSSVMGDGVKRVVPRTVTPYRVDAAGNRYVVTLNGQLARVQPSPRMSMASMPLRRNYMNQPQRFQGDVKPFAPGGVFGDGGETVGGGFDSDCRQSYVRHIGGYPPRPLGGIDQHSMPTGFRRVDYTTMRTAADYRRPVDRAYPGPFREDLVKREHYDWPPRLIPVGGASGGGYRVATSSPPPPTTRLRPVNPRRAFGQLSNSGPTQIRAGDSPDTRVCKTVLRDILDEVCLNDATARPVQSLNQSGISVKQEVREDVGGADRTQQQKQDVPTGNNQPFPWQDSLQRPALQRRTDTTMEDPQRARIRQRVSSPVARQIVSMRDVYELPFDQIARHFKLEPHVVRFAYIQLKKHSFRSVGRPRKSESEERRNNDHFMPFVSNGRMPPSTNQIGIPNPAVPLPARYTSDELNIFIDAYRKEVTKRRNLLERRAEEEIGIIMPWNRSRSKNVKTTKRQVPKKENTNVEDTFSLCDPRYISLGGNTVPFEEMPMKMELDLSGNAKITTQSELLNKTPHNNNTHNTGTANEENDESDEDDDSSVLNHKSKNTQAIGNDESENDSTEYDTSADEDNSGVKSAKFASVKKPAKPTDKKVTAAMLKKAAQEERKRERELKKAAKQPKPKIKVPKSRADGQRQRRDRERRLQMIQMRKKGSSAAHEKDLPTTKAALRNARNMVAMVKKSNVRRSIFADKDNKDAGPAKYCPCGGSYDPKKVYVSCNKCSRWYHGKCAGLTEKRAQKLAADSSDWTCSECEKSSTEVYCVCRRPYDESRFYVGCDACEDWFHPECIGTTQSEVSKHDSFLCPKCRESDVV